MFGYMLFHLTPASLRRITFIERIPIGLFSVFAAPIDDSLNMANAQGRVIENETLYRRNTDDATKIKR